MVCRCVSHYTLRPKGANLHTRTAGFGLGLGDPVSPVGCLSGQQEGAFKLPLKSLPEPQRLQVSSTSFEAADSLFAWTDKRLILEN